METVLITGANRGIGLEHTRQALAAGNCVIAACRNPETAMSLNAFLPKYKKTLRIEQLDLSDGNSIEALGNRLDGAAIDILLNSAGMYGGGWANESDREKQSMGGMDYELWRQILQVNVLGNFQLTARLRPNIGAGERKIIVMMSSDLGSISNNTQGMSHAYRSSKAALNMVTKGLSVELQPDGITVISLAPGWVRTDLGGDDAQWNVDDSVAHQREVLASLSIKDTGKFLNLLGQTVPW